MFSFQAYTLCCHRYFAIDNDSIIHMKLNINHFNNAKLGKEMTSTKGQEGLPVFLYKQKLITWHTYYWL